MDSGSSRASALLEHRRWHLVEPNPHAHPDARAAPAVQQHDQPALQLRAVPDAEPGGQQDLAALEPRCRVGGSRSMCAHDTWPRSESPPLPATSSSPSAGSESSEDSHRPTLRIVTRAPALSICPNGVGPGRTSVRGHAPGSSYGAWRHEYGEVHQEGARPWCGSATASRRPIRPKTQSSSSRPPTSSATTRPTESTRSTTRTSGCCSPRRPVKPARSGSDRTSPT